MRDVVTLDPPQSAASSIFYSTVTLNFDLLTPGSAASSIFYSTVTLNFDLLTPGSEAFISVPKGTKLLMLSRTSLFDVLTKINVNTDT